MTAPDRFDVFLCPGPDDRIEKALRADGLRVFPGNPFDDFDMIAVSRVLLADCAGGTDRVLTTVPGEPLEALVRRVRERVAETAGPFGPSVLGTVHSALTARRVVLLRGLPGTGKTTLAERYADLFGRFGGPVLRTGPFGGLDPDDFLPQFHLALATAARVRAPGFERLRRRLAARIEAAGSKVLLLVDDVPAGLPPGVLDRILLPAGSVRTLVTSRFAQPRWNAATVDVPGLTPAEAARPALPASFAARCDGHPMTLRAAAFLQRGSVPDTAPEAIREVLRSTGRLARDLLRLGAVLAPAAIPPEVARAALGAPAPAEFEAAVAELVTHGFAALADGGVRLQGLAVEVAAGEFGELCPDRAAEAVLDALPDREVLGGVLFGTASVGGSGQVSAGPADETAPGRDGPNRGGAAPGPANEPAPGGTGGDMPSPGGAAPGPANEPAPGGTGGDVPGPGEVSAEPAANRVYLLLQHARALADRVPAHRVALLRPLAAAHECLGDSGTAGEIHAAILATGQATSADFVAAARGELDCGLDSEAVGHAREALALAADEGGHRAAALVAAQALDALGDYAEADRTFWLGHLPASPEERLHAAVAQRLRGRPDQAIALLEPAFADLPDVLRDRLNLEYARNLLQTGQPARARQVVTGEEPEAELIRADATLALADEEPAALQTTYTEHYGAEHPLTLIASVHAGRALLAAGQPQLALEALTKAGETVRRVLGDDHRLHFRVRHALGLAHARLREFDRQADLLEPLLGPQIRLLGRTHPETLETRLDLGLALALSGRGPREEATRLVDDAAREAVGAGPLLAAKARAAQQVVRLPLPFVSALHTLERLVWPGR
ncbi:hypothetical protein GCM10027258_95510 [Amycolatopsis stemonae]